MMPPNPESLWSHFPPQPPSSPQHNEWQPSHPPYFRSSSACSSWDSCSGIQTSPQFAWLNRSSQSPSPYWCVNYSPIQHGNFRRGTNRCVVCKDHMKEGDTFTSHSNSTSHQIRGNITCSTPNVIYLISCSVCGIQYVGETRTTFYGHRSTVNIMKLDTPVGQHFNLPNHSITDMILQGIESLGTRLDTDRASREKMWMRRLRTIQPHDLKHPRRKRLTLLFLFQQFFLLISRPIFSSFISLLGWCFSPFIL